MTAFRIFLGLLLCCFAVGCAERHVVSVDALGAPHSEKRYVVLFDTRRAPTGNQVYPGILSLVENTLTSQGYRLADAASADAAVLVFCSLDRTRGTVVGVADEFGNSAPFWGPYGGSFVAVTAVRAGDTSWSRALLLEAVELRREGPDKAPVYGAMLWKLALYSRGGEGDPRVVLPRMLEAGKPYIGGDTHGIRAVDVTEVGQTPVVRP
jgi:hypothetical protein